MFFHLWGDDGPKWVHEFHNFLQEEEASRKKVGSNPVASKASYAEVVRNLSGFLH
jgi:hypothetical protein